MHKMLISFAMRMRFLIALTVLVGGLLLWLLLQAISLLQPNPWVWRVLPTMATTTAAAMGPPLPLLSSQTLWRQQQQQQQQQRQPQWTPTITNTT
jgi:hypothetical protein